MSKIQIRKGVTATDLLRRLICRATAPVLAAALGLACTGMASAQAETTEAQRLMFQFQNTRLNNLVRHQPSLVSFMSGAGSGALNADVGDHRGVLKFSSGFGGRLWARANGRWDTTGQRRDKYGFGAVGLHGLVTPNFIVGGIIEADYLSHAGTLSTRAGRGVMAGSYFLSRLAAHPVYVEGRLLRGTASHRIWRSADGTRWPGTRRGLAQLKLSGQLRYGATTLTPRFLASYATDGVSTGIADPFDGQGIRQHRIEMGLAFRHTLRRDNGARIVVTGSGAFANTYTRRDGYDALAMPSLREGRSRVNLGVSFMTNAGGAIAIDSFLGGIGPYAPRTYGLKAGYTIQF